MMRKKMIVAAACAFAAACGGGDEGNNTAAPAGGNEAAAATSTGRQNGQAKAHLLESLGGSADHATFVKAVNAAGLSQTFSGAQPYTIFAPTEAAFAKLPQGTVDGLLAPDARGQLTALLTGHIVPGTVTAQDLTRAIERGKGKAQLATVGGTTLSFSGSGDALVVTDAKGGQARLAGESMASNGVIHSLDGVLAAQ